MSLIASHWPHPPDSEIPGSDRTSNSPANARLNPSSACSRSTVARNPISPKLTPNTGMPVPAYIRSAPRIVPSPPSAKQMSTSVRSSAFSSSAGAGSSPCLAVSSGLEPEHGAGLAGERQQRLDRRRRLRRPAVGENRGAADRVHGSTVRAARSRSSTPAPPRLRQPHERLAVALRPGQPRAGVAEHRRAERPGGAADIDQRGAPQLGIADHAALADRLAPDLELRLDQREAVEADRPRSRSTAGRTFASEMNDTSITIRSGAVREVVRAQRPGVASARSPSPAHPSEAASRARRRRRPRR